MAEVLGRRALNRALLERQTSLGRRGLSAFCCAVGSVLEERYEHLDDGCVPDHARLRKIWQLWWGPGGGASTMLPGDEGIHRVGNPGEDLAISVHLYGPRTGEADGRDYDPSRDYVCDRREG